MTQRIIKFRAWLYLDETMQYESLFGAEKFGGRDCEIMQFTGLKDKTGREVFEGDLVRFKDNPLTFQVYWNNEEARWDYRDVNENSTYPDRTGWQIIGNIYEHPTLISHPLT